MTPRTLSYRTFAEIARETAKRRYPKSWRAYRDDTLNSLIHDFWCGRFIDAKGQNCTFDLSHRQGGAYDLITREVVWRMLGDTRPRNLQDFHDGNLPPWDIVAPAKIEDYGSVARVLFENLALSEADASAWMEQYRKENLPPNVGRPTLMPKIEEEMKRRAIEEELLPSMYQESQHLRGWAEENHSDRMTLIPTKERIESTLASLYKELRAKHASE